MLVVDVVVECPADAQDIEAAHEHVARIHGPFQDDEVEQESVDLFPPCWKAILIVVEEYCKAVSTRFGQMI